MKPSFYLGKFLYFSKAVTKKKKKNNIKWSRANLSVRKAEETREMQIHGSVANWLKKKKAQIQERNSNLDEKNNWPVIGVQNDITNER